MAEPIKAIVVASASRNSAALNSYVRDEKEDQAKGERFVAASGINGCIPELAEKQMRDNRKRWGKNGSREVLKKHGADEAGNDVNKRVTEGVFVQSYHVIQSFARDGIGGLDPSDSGEWEKAHDLGVELARKVAGKHRLATVHTQLDGKTGCIHNHIVIDSVDKATGRSFDSAQVKHSALVAVHDSMLAEQGYEQAVEYAPKGTAKGAVKVEKSELRGLAKHQAWEAGDCTEPEPFSVAVLKHRIREALAEESFTDLEAFFDVAISHGVLADERGQGGRGITYAMMRDDGLRSEWLEVSPGDRRRASKLGRDFMMDAVEEAIERNKALEAVRAKQVQTKSTTATKGKVSAEPVPRQPDARKPAATATSRALAEQRAAQDAKNQEILADLKAKDEKARTQWKLDEQELFSQLGNPSQSSKTAPKPQEPPRRRAEPAVASPPSRQGPDITTGPRASLVEEDEVLEGVTAVSEEVPGDTDPFVEAEPELKNPEDWGEPNNEPDLIGMAEVVDEVPTAPEEALESTEEAAVAEPSVEQTVGVGSRHADEPRALDQEKAQVRKDRHEKFPALKNMSVDRLKLKDWGEPDHESEPRRKQ